MVRCAEHGLLRRAWSAAPSMVRRAGLVCLLRCTATSDSLRRHCPTPLYFWRRRRRCRHVCLAAASVVRRWHFSIGTRTCAVRAHADRQGPRGSVNLIVALLASGRCSSSLAGQVARTTDALAKHAIVTEEAAPDGVRHHRYDDKKHQNRHDTHGVSCNVVFFVPIGF
jgi:hypothetical protein